MTIGGTSNTWKHKMDFKSIINSTNAENVDILYIVILLKSHSGPDLAAKSKHINVDALLSVFPQPQSTDFTQYNSYGDMCGGGRGESCNEYEATKPIFANFTTAIQHQYWGKKWLTTCT